MLCLVDWEGFDSDEHDRGRASGEEGWGGAPAGMWARLGARPCLRDMPVTLGRSSTLGGYRTEEGREDGRGRAARARVDEKGGTRG